MTDEPKLGPGNIYAVDNEPKIVALEKEVSELKIQMARGQRDEIAKQLELAERNLELTMKLEERG